jgi:hypothetical protein
MNQVEMKSLGLRISYYDFASQPIATRFFGGLRRRYEGQRQQ